MDKIMEYFLLLSEEREAAGKKEYIPSESFGKVMVVVNEYITKIPAKVDLEIQSRESTNLSVIEGSPLGGGIVVKKSNRKKPSRKKSFRKKLTRRKSTRRKSTRRKSTRKKLSRRRRR